MSPGTAIIIGAGPAGLTAAYELLDKTDIKPIVYEIGNQVGGISKTVVYKGNRIDIGGHRFFSKSDIVMQWWQNILPLQGAPARDDFLLKRSVNLSTDGFRRELGSRSVVRIPPPNPEVEDKVMLVRNRLSRILFSQTFFDYPVRLNGALIRNLGLLRMARIGMSYIKAQICPRKQETSLEDFMINRFGKELYSTFFRDYTEKVWGISCDQIKPEWGAQRIKGLSVMGAIVHALKNLVAHDTAIEQKNVETSLINQFLYPKFGPGQMWEDVARQIADHGGEIHLNKRVVGLKNNLDKIDEVTVRDERDGSVCNKACDFVFSTMPVKELIAAFANPAPEEVTEVANGLIYRDFLTVGLLTTQLKMKNQTKVKTIGDIVPDNWIYVQETSVKLGRIQIFN